MSDPAYSGIVEGDRLAAIADKSNENAKAIAALFPLVPGRTEFGGMMLRDGATPFETVEVQDAAVGKVSLWKMGEPMADHRAWSTASVSDGVKVSTPFRPRVVMLHARGPNQNYTDGGEESRLLVFELDGDGVDGPVPVMVYGASVAAGQGVQEVSCTFEADGFTIDVEGDHPAEVDLLSALVLGDLEGVPDPSAGDPAARQMITSSLTPGDLATARNETLLAVRSRNRGPAPPESPLEGELWADTTTGWMRQWVLEGNTAGGVGWVDVFPLGGDVDALFRAGPYAPGSVPDFDDRVFWSTTEIAAVLVELQYPRAGVDGGETLYDRSTALLVADEEYFAVPVAEDPTASVTLAAGIEKKTVRVKLDFIAGVGHLVAKFSLESNSADAVAAVEIVNVSYLGTY